MKETNKEKSQLVKKYKISLMILAYPVFMVLILGPLETYYANISEFDFLISDFIWGFILVSVVFLVFFSLVLSLFKRKIYNIIMCIICSLSITAYIQNMFLNKKLSMENGERMDWHSYNIIFIINTILWIIIFSILFCFLYYVVKKHGIKKLCYVSLAFCIIQMVAIFSVLLGIINYKKTVPHYQLSGDQQFYVAQNNNVVILMLDATASNLFEEVYSEDSSIASNLSDFTFYNNYDSLYSPTFPSIIHMLTGEDPDTKYTRWEYAKNAWNSEKSNYFFGKLHSNGYTCNLYSNRQTYTYGDISFLEGKIDNIEHIESKTNYKLMYPIMIKYSLYRYSPYIIKPRFEVIDKNLQGVVYYDQEDEIVTDNTVFYNRINDNGLKINVEWNNAFILEHIDGMHNIYLSEYDEKKSNIKELFEICDAYIDDLKVLGLYEDATIIIMADHGEYEDKNMWQPIFFIKRPNEHHEKMAINNAPISGDDFQATILDIIGEDYSLCGTSIYDWKENQKRERTTWHMDKSASGGLFGYTYYTDGDEIKNKGDYEIKYYSTEW